MSTPPLLIVGAQGQVGREVAELAAARGLNAVAWGRSELDISRRQDVLAKVAELKPAAVINCAAYTAVDKAESEHELAFAINRDAPGYLAEACAETGARLLHISTDYVFDGTATRPYREDDPVNPLGVYGLSKWEGEERIRAVLPEHTILRTSWVFGRYGNNFVKTMLRLGRERAELRIVDDQFGCPTEAYCIASALLDLESRPPTGTYHLTGAPVTTWFRFASAVFELTHNQGRKTPKLHPIQTSDYPTPARRPAWSVLDCQKLQNSGLWQHPDWMNDLPRVLDELMKQESAV
ncbi:MAG: dTDP-4-dehydrorhamnose reductase [Gammaproteobacteria bacterium]|nr:dTDP-4-dehydrorhamnose reductase [Gammaproteobacteria bacterium]